MKRALVCGAGGFIAGHLIKFLKEKGYWVRGVDIKEHEFAESAADEFMLLDLREPDLCTQAVSLNDGKFDETYQLAADIAPQPATASSDGTSPVTRTAMSRSSWFASRVSSRIRATSRRASSATIDVWPTRSWSMASRVLYRFNDPDAGS